jgi:hypothetical protein
MEIFVKNKPYSLILVILLGEIGNFLGEILELKINKRLILQRTYLVIEKNNP